MKIGFVGPASGEAPPLREALEFLLHDVGVEQAVYLGTDDLIEEVVSSWRDELWGDHGTHRNLLDHVPEALQAKGAAPIEALLKADNETRRLSAIRRIPDSPARAVEMVEDRIVTAVFDKAVLDEEDIANSMLLVFGRSNESMFRRFGPRSFFTPGPLSGGHIGVLDAESDGPIHLRLFDISGAPVWTELLHAKASAKMTVSA